jgi:hypothetical protein
MYQWQRIHIFDELERHGVFFEVINPFDFPSIDSANEFLLSKVKTDGHYYDIFLSCESSERLFLNTIIEIKKCSIPTLLICFDNLHAPYMHKVIAPFFDLVWLTSYETKYLFDNWGCTSIVLPYAANPYLADIKKPSFNEIESIGFVGTLYGARARKVKLLHKNKIPYVVYGSKNEQSQIVQIDTNFINTLLEHLSFPIGRTVLLGSFLERLSSISKNYLENDFLLDIQVESISFNELVNLYTQFALSLNVTELRNTFHLKRPVHKLHLRTFEIPMFGGLQLAPFSKELSEYFEDRNEILLYSSNDEMVQIANDFLKPNRQRDRIRMKFNAYLRAKSEHTWKCRFDKAFTKLLGKSNLIG